MRKSKRTVAVTLTWMTGLHMLLFDPNVELGIISIPDRVNLLSITMIS